MGTEVGVLGGGNVGELDEVWVGKTSEVLVGRFAGVPVPVGETAGVLLAKFVGVRDGRLGGVPVSGTTGTLLAVLVAVLSSPFVGDNEAGASVASAGWVTTGVTGVCGVGVVMGGCSPVCGNTCRGWPTVAVNSVPAETRAEASPICTATMPSSQAM